MPSTKKEVSNGRAFAVPLAWIAGLLGAYWVLADWEALPRLIGATLAAIQ